MAPFRPSNLNKRAYPGNASVIGPTSTTTCSASTTCCCETRTCKDACQTYPLNLGCRCCCCGCPCCQINTCCECTVCTRTQSKGMWKTSEVYTAREADEWGDSTSSNTPEGIVNTVGTGVTDITVQKDFKGFYIKSNCAFVSPNAYQVGSNWHNRNNAVTCSNTLVSCSWFIPSCDWYKQIGSPCRTYWDQYVDNYWTDTEANGQWAYVIGMNNGTAFNYAQYKTRGKTSRALRTTR